MHLQDLAWWQWPALPGLLLVAWAGGFLLGRLSRVLLVRLGRRATSIWNPELVGRLSGPLATGWTVALVYAGLPWLQLPEAMAAGISRALRLAFLIAVFWAAVRAADIGSQLISGSRWAKERPGSRAIIPLGARVAKVAVVAIGAVAFLSELGYPVASILAGLGIGGLAVALAARSTLENLFGAFSIGADQPIREGDSVKIEDFVGTVETIGLRSTKIRTLDRSIISMPNGKLADMRLESFAPRDRIRLSCTLGLVYGTTAAQIRAILAGVSSALQTHPKIWPNEISVYFQELGASSLDVGVTAWFQTLDFNEFQAIRQDLLLRFMEIVEKAGSSLAFPTHTVHVVPAEPPRPSVPTSILPPGSRRA